MIVQPSHSDISVTDYLTYERQSPIRHEYVDGQMYAMAGASDRHNRLALNLAARLNDWLDGGPCEAFISDMQVQVAPTVYYYPDVVVTCDPLDNAPYMRSRPCLLIEVVSPSTARIDRHEKLTAYCRMPSVQEYVLVQQDRMLIEVYRRQPTGQWLHETYEQPEDVVPLTSVGLTIRVQEVYRNVRWGAR